jgi:DNA polymerase III epsilon subunit-like protein
MKQADFIYISVDIEAAGSTPGEYALLAIGACTVEQPETGFYIELQPDRPKVDPSAIEVSGLDYDQLQHEGVPPKQAMKAFERWLKNVAPMGQQPVFVAFNAPFDWMFIADYFHRYLGYNPFGHRALDIKALYMGGFGVTWEETSMEAVSNRLGFPVQLSHNALEDSQDQARIFNALLGKLNEQKKDEGLR